MPTYRAKGHVPLTKDPPEALDGVVDGLCPPLLDAAAGIRPSTKGEAVGDAGRVDHRQNLDVPAGVARRAHEIGKVIPDQVKVVMPTELERSWAGAGGGLLGDKALGQVPRAHQVEEESGPPRAEAVAVTETNVIEIQHMVILVGIDKQQGLMIDGLLDLEVGVLGPGEECAWATGVSAGGLGLASPTLGSRQFVLSMRTLILTNLEEYMGC